jgi:hypothetical protein
VPKHRDKERESPRATPTQRPTWNSTPFSSVIARLACSAASNDACAKPRGRPSSLEIAMETLVTWGARTCSERERERALYAGWKPEGI